MTPDRLQMAEFPGKAAPGGLVFTLGLSHAPIPKERASRPCPFGVTIVHNCYRCPPDATDTSTACDSCMPCTDVRCIAEICPQCTPEQSCMDSSREFPHPCMYLIAPPRHCVETCPYDD